MDQHTQGNQRAGNIGKRPAGIANDLEGRHLFRPMIKISLKEGLAAISERFVHANQHFAMLVTFVVVEPNPAGVILRNARTFVAVETELDKVQPKGSVSAGETH
jgi:hypothetical protein